MLSSWVDALSAVARSGWITPDVRDLPKQLQRAAVDPTTHDPYHSQLEQLCAGPSSKLHLTRILTALRNEVRAFVDRALDGEWSRMPEHSK